MIRVRCLSTLLVLATSFVLILIPSISAGLIAGAVPESVDDAAPKPLADSLAASSHPRIPALAEHSVKNVRRHHKPHSGPHVTNGKATFYAGHQLDNPACPGATTPNDSSMIAAISDDSPFACGDHLRITDASGRQAVVKVVDRCEGCTSNWLDLTKGAFTRFSSLDTGVLTDLTITKVG